jgi:hypothetical protein
MTVLRVKILWIFHFFFFFAKDIKDIRVQRFRHKVEKMSLCQVIHKKNYIRCGGAGILLVVYNQ